MATTRFIANSAATTAGIVALLGILAKRLGIPWVGDAVAFVIKMPGVEFNWDFLWLVLLVGSSVVLVGMNFAVAKRWNENRIEKKKRYWNMNLCDAISYIGWRSHYGRAWPEKDKQRCAAGALYEAAKNGAIDIAGLPKGSMALAKIPQDRFDGKRIFELKHCTRDDEKNVFLLEADMNTVDYSALIADRQQIEKQWPPKPPSFW